MNRLENSKINFLSIGPLSPGKLQGGKSPVTIEAGKRQKFIDENDTSSDESVIASPGQKEKIKKRKIFRSNETTPRTPPSSSPINLPDSDDMFTPSSPVVDNNNEDPDETILISSDEELEHSMLNIDEAIFE